MSGSLSIATLWMVIVANPLGLPASDQQIIPGRLPCQDRAFSREAGWRQLGWEIVQRSSIEAAFETKAVTPGKKTFFQSPLLIWSCQGPISPLSPEQIRDLRSFLANGGFLWIDDPNAKPGNPFWLSVQQVLTQLFPTSKPHFLPEDHVLFRSFFRIQGLYGRKYEQRLSGIDLHGRLAVVLSQNDVLGAMSKAPFGGFQYLCEPNGEFQREMSFRLGINIVFYAVCTDYKDDRVHLDYILKRRRL